ncbi:MAG: AAA family ATPase [bacterium]|jgi:putative ATPase
MLEPIASLLRPNNLDEFVGQVHLVGENKPIRVFLQNKNIPSMIFWGPPGCGKTTMAHIISQTLQADFFPLSGVTSKKEDLTKLIDQAKLNHQYGKQTIIFLDEIHRWNKAQQDVLLPFVEK